MVDTYYLATDFFNLEVKTESEKVFETRVLLKKNSATSIKIPHFLWPLQTDLEQYSKGKLQQFHFGNLYQFQFTAFQTEVYEVLQGTLPTQTLTYKEIAIQTGKPNAARAVGSAMRKNPFPLIIPCHRVIPSHGKSLGRYSGTEDSAINGEATKAYLLSCEKKVFSHLQLREASVSDEDFSNIYEESVT